GLDNRHQLLVELALQQAVAFLAADVTLEAEMGRGPLRLDHLPSRQCRACDVANLALMDEIVERPQRLLDRGPRTGDVLIVEVEAIGAEAPEAGLDCRHDVGARGSL